MTRAEYFWETAEGFGAWQIMAHPTDSLAILPDLPPALVELLPLGQDPEFGYFYVDVVDYKDLDGYAELMAAGRMSWSLFSAAVENFLAEGGSLASATASDSRQ